MPPIFWYHDARGGGVGGRGCDADNFLNMIKLFVVERNSYQFTTTSLRTFMISDGTARHRGNSSHHLEQPSARIHF